MPTPRPGGSGSPASRTGLGRRGPRSSKTAACSTGVNLLRVFHPSDGVWGWPALRSGARERVGGTDERVPPTMAEMLANALHEQTLWLADHGHVERVSSSADRGS